MAITVLVKKMNEQHFFYSCKICSVLFSIQNFKNSYRHDIYFCRYLNVTKDLLDLYVAGRNLWQGQRTCPGTTISSQILSYKSKYRKEIYIKLKVIELNSLFITCNQTKPYGMDFFIHYCCTTTTSTCCCLSSNSNLCHINVCSTNNNIATNRRKRKRRKIIYFFVLSSRSSFFPLISIITITT